MIKVAGDINFTDGFFDTGFGVGSSLIDGKDPFSKLKRNNGDLWVGNFECVTSKESNNNGIKKKQFIIDPKYLKHFEHFNYYNVANNHSMQHGEESFRSMLTSITKFGSEYFGANKKRSVKFKHQGVKVSLTSFSLRNDGFGIQPLYWNNPEYYQIKEEYNALSDCDFKILYVHWGNEFIDVPYEDQKKFAHSLIDMGFDLIIGMHPHLLQGYEIYKGKYIFYSIGNFVFNMPSDVLQYGAIIKIDFQNNDIKIDFDYIHIEKDFFPIVIDESKVPMPYRFPTLNRKLSLHQNNEEYYHLVDKGLNLYRRDNYKYIISNTFNYKLLDLSSVIIDF
ncbi:MAG: CapA family protein, partial [Rikenellaceae bacterium]